MASQPPARRWTLIASHSTLTLFWESREALKNGMPSKKGRVVLEMFILGACASSRVLPWRSPRIPAVTSCRTAGPISRNAARQGCEGSQPLRCSLALAREKGPAPPAPPRSKQLRVSHFPLWLRRFSAPPRLVSHCRLWAGHIDLWARANPTQIWTAHVASKKVFAH